MRLRSHLASIGILAFAAALGVSSAHAEFAFRPDQAAAKLTAAAKRLKAPFPFEHRICAVTDRANCAFLAGSVVGMASGAQHGMTERVDLVLPPGESNYLDMSITWGILMALISPEMGPNDRGALAMRFMRAIDVPGFTTISEQRGVVTYSISRDDELGLHFVAIAKTP